MIKFRVPTIKTPNLLPEQLCCITPAFGPSLGVADRSKTSMLPAFPASIRVLVRPTIVVKNGTPPLPALQPMTALAGPSRFVIDATAYP
jgi:hypothetical protein